MNALLVKLHEMRAAGVAPRTTGLDDTTVESLVGNYPELAEVIDAAYAAFLALRSSRSDLLKLDESAQAHAIQADYVNFYPDDGVNPYVALSARGPWIVTLKGAVIHDSGGYGMLGFGHAPKPVLEVLARAQVMANVMTPNLAQLRMAEALKREIGHTRGGSPYTRFLCLNSGSESVSLAARIADVNSKLMTDEGGRYAGREIKRLAVKGAFHGRTDRPALYSNSSRKVYEQNLASYRNETSVITVDAYDVEQLRKVFADAEKNNWFIEALFLEPVMGEGDPGRAVTVEFYKAARELTKAHGSLLLIDSIQAGLRAHGVLSFVDYPGMEDIEEPDMETYSKALNAGQFPLSVLAVNERAADLYKRGIYGNTMTTNPRALDVACVVLDMLTPEVRENIRARGRQFVDKLNALKAELPGYITKVQGTGLLFSCELSPDFKCYGADSTEEWMREHGIGVIHGGTNSLRFTPHFSITDAEVELLVDGVRKALVEGPRKAQAKKAAA
ncbi:MAG TPA: aminotransferase class III-fold pyridoxal phosphate-dependent enzyme [Dokdonella sp.]|uniref:aminotransferase class III-fold pyridoxal phosphate-dependent enzyme n=1 Tax=Dokdonella sp. TaxID=2291710 RepID=UPI002D8106D7|nr:aminotransferase class III-fold pyridoxal phosphate-dependent enzyme [Dokdonella sp.]HET9032390.1 aminotransferase class III-fold pyridoxal phosphate-dependent enzyme [Dokdonella sp.]